MAKVSHFKTGEIAESHMKFLPPETYAIVRDSTVRACVDVLVGNQHGKFLLGKRVIEPWPDWWVFGGRMIPGENPQDAVSRMTKEDIGLDVVPERFVYLGFRSLVWGRRSEPPQENGCHDLGILYLLLIEDVEISLIKFRRGEYSEVKWMDPKEIIMEPSFHPAVVEAIQQASALVKKEA